VLCKFDGCKNQKRGEYCPAHYEQKRSGKTLKPLQLQYHGLTEEARFLKRTVVDEQTGCWNWTGSVMKVGWHGQWRNAAGNIEPTHRAAWRLFKSPIPKGVSICHKCDNPICVNPAHLFIGSQADNMKDMWAKGRARPKSSIGECHGMSKVTSEIVKEIRSSSETGMALAEKFGISATTVCDIKKRRTWNHIK
jgi:hypothetical protein